MRIVVHLDGSRIVGNDAQQVTDVVRRLVECLARDVPSVDVERVTVLDQSGETMLLFGWGKRG